MVTFESVFPERHIVLLLYTDLDAKKVDSEGRIIQENEDDSLVTVKADNDIGNTAEDERLVTRQWEPCGGIVFFVADNGCLVMIIYCYSFLRSINVFLNVLILQREKAQEKDDSTLVF